MAAVFCKQCKRLHPAGQHTRPQPASKDEQRLTAFRELWAAADVAEQRLRKLCDPHADDPVAQQGLVEAVALRKALTDWKGML
jgi:hypothetical protein